MQEYPQKAGIDKILKDAFSYWSRTLYFQLIFSLIFFSILFLVTYYFSTKYGILQQYEEAFKKISSVQDYTSVIMKISSSPEYQKLSWATLLTLAFLYPLNLGFYKIYRKLDLKEEVNFEDLFSGYNGSNFFIYTSYYLFWVIVYSYSFSTIFLAIIWIFVTLFSAPLMFFMDKRIFETISLNFKALKKYPMEIFVCSMVAFGFKYFGIITLLGAFFTIPFWNAMIYAMYKSFFNEADKKN